MNPLLSIIIIDYNASGYLIPCLESIVSQRFDFDYEIIVVDNASKENHCAEYEAIDSKIKTIRLDKNVGFGGGNNAGVKSATGEYIFLLNPDTLIVDDSIQKMLGFAIENDTYQSSSVVIPGCGVRPGIQESATGSQISGLSGMTSNRNDNNIGIICPTIVVNDKPNAPEEVDYYGDFPTLATLISRNNHRHIVKHLGGERGANTSEVFNGYLEVERVTGASMLMKKSLFEDLGGFDEHFFMYFEDTDLCKRALDKGYKNIVLKDTRLIHFGGQTQKNTKQKKQRYYAAQNYFFTKHYGLFTTSLMRLCRLPMELMKGIFAGDI